MIFSFRTTRNFRVVVNNEWWAVAKDIAIALGYKDTINAVKQHCDEVAKHHIGVATGKYQKLQIVVNAL